MTQESDESQPKRTYEPLTPEGKQRVLQNVKAYQDSLRAAVIEESVERNRGEPNRTKQ